MAPEQNTPSVRDHDQEFSDILQRIFYFEESEEDQSVQSFVDWCNASAEFGPVSKRPIYDMIAGRAKLSIKFILAVRTWSPDPELHALFAVDNSVATAAAASLRTAADMLEATANRLDGNGKGSG